MNMGLKQKGLMVAIDTDEKKEYERVKDALPSLSELGEDVIFKLGLPTVLRFGFNNSINLLKHYDNRIVFDAKLAEDEGERHLRRVEKIKEIEKKFR